jgi:hypothetical protein
MIAATRVPILRSSGRQSLEGLLQLRLGDLPLIAPNSNCKAVGTAASPPRKSGRCKPTPSQHEWAFVSDRMGPPPTDAAACDASRQASATAPGRAAGPRLGAFIGSALTTPFPDTGFDSVTAS